MASPRALLVSGPAGSGKSTLAAALAAGSGAALLDLDVLTNPLVSVVAGLVGAGADIEQPQLRALVRDARYVVLLDAAEAQIGVGLDVVVAAPFTAEVASADAWDTVRGRLLDAGAGEVSLVWLQASAALLVDRISRRAAPRDRAKLEQAQQFLGELRPPAVPALAVDAALGLDDQVAAVLDAIG
jgi:predicted kinase